MGEILNMPKNQWRAGRTTPSQCLQGHRTVLWAPVPGDVLLVAGLWGEGFGKGMSRERPRKGTGRANTGLKDLGQ